VIHWFLEKNKKKTKPSANPTKHLPWQNNYYAVCTLSALGKRETKGYDLPTDFCRNSANGITFYRGQCSSSGL